MEKQPLVGNRYRLIEMIGEGATKEVFLARDETLHREVALCQFKEHMLADGYLSQVQREARTLADLSHPNILVILDFRDDDSWYMITEYIGGGSLKEKMDSDWKASPDMPEVLRIAAEVADALSFTHARGTFHRDIKPSNVMLTKEGTAKLADFGMAKPITDDTISGTLTGRIEGTIPYMSPEQAKGLRPDSPADMYSFGVMLYEMAVGRRPFQGEDVTVLVHHLQDVPPPPTHFSPTCPPKLEKLILELLEKEPTVRPNASQVAEELRGIRTELLGEEPGSYSFDNDVKEPTLDSEFDDEIPTVKSLKFDRLSNSIQDPLSIIPLFIAIVLVLAAITFGSNWTLALSGAALSLSIGVTSFIWRYLGRCAQEYEGRLQSLRDAEDRRTKDMERQTLLRTLDNLRTGFTRVGSDEGVRVLDRLVNEFDQLQESVGRWPQASRVSSGQIGQISALAEETYREGLNVLNSVLELLMSIDTSDKKGLEIEVEALETNMQILKEDETQSERFEIRMARRSEYKERLELLNRQEIRAEEFLLKSSLIEGALYKIRIEAASLRVDSSDGSVSAVIEALQNTINQAREVLEEMRDLGF